MEPAFITDAKGEKKKVVLTLNQYTKLLNNLEDLEDTVVGLKARLVKNPKYYKWEDVKKQIYG